MENYLIGDGSKDFAISYIFLVLAHKTANKAQCTLVTTLSKIVDDSKDPQLLDTIPKVKMIAVLLTLSFHY